MTNEDLEEIRKRWARVEPGPRATALLIGKADVEALLAHIEGLYLELYPHGIDTPQQIMSSAFACADARINMLLLVIDKLDIVEHEKDSLRVEVLAGRRALRIAANGDGD